MMPITIRITERRAVVTGPGLGSSGPDWSHAIEWDEAVPALPREPAEVLAAATRLGECLQSKYPEGTTARVILPASWCFLRFLPCDSTAVTDHALAYQLEDSIPVDLEPLTYACRVEGGIACVAAVFTQPMSAFLDQLERHRVVVELLTVDAAVVVTEPTSNADDSRYAHMLSTTDSLSGVARRSQHDCPCVHTVPDCGETRHRVHQLGLFCAGSGVWLHDPHREDALGAHPSFDHVLRALDASRNPLNLRRGPLACAGRWRAVRRGLFRCGVAAVALLAIGSLRMQMTTHKRTVAAAALERSQLAVYERLFPGMVPPPGASLRVRAERRRLEGLTRASDTESPPRKQEDVDLFLALHEFTSRLPRHIRLRVNELEVDEEGIRASGQTPTHAAVGDWVQEINRSDFLRAEPPRTNLRRDGTVDFRIHAKREAPHGTN